MVVMRILIAGAGGVGGYFGARLARGGHAVAMLARGATLGALRRHGVRVRSTLEGEFTAAVEAVGNVGGLGPVDAVLLCVKSFDTGAVVESLRPAVGPGTPVLSLQNGVDNEEIIDEVLGPGQAMGGVAYVFATIEEPGVIGHRFGGRIAFGELDGTRTPRAERLAEAFATAGVPAELATDIRRVLWEKYLFISAQAGMTALTRCPTGVLRRVPESWRMYRAIVEELAAVARAAGMDLGPDAVERVMAAAAQLGDQNYSSLHHDLVHGKRLELEALHGHAVRLGDKLGVATPMVTAVYAGLKPHLDGRPA
jgi:2-dehydropantoate 2-reductase